MTWQSLQVVAAANAGLQFVSLKLGYLLLTFISRESAPTGFNNRCLERFGADGLKSPQKVILLWFRESSFPDLWAGTFSGGTLRPAPETPRSILRTPGPVGPKDQCQWQVS